MKLIGGESSPRYKLLTTSILFGFIVVTSGCKDSGQTSTGNNVGGEVLASPAISAEALSYNSLVGSSTTINVDDHVVTSNNSDYILASASSLSGDDCKVVIVGSNHLELSSFEAKDCVYRYQVSTLDKKAKADATIRLAFASTYSSEQLPRVVTSTLENVPITIDLRTELGAELPEQSFTLQQEIVAVAGGVVEYVDEYHIRFTPSKKGQSEIYYSYANDSAIKQGVISVSTSADEVNNPPTADKFAYDKLVKIGETVTVDVASYISDLDGDEIQLVAVEDFNSSVNPFLRTDIHNTKFTFLSTEPGTHDVAYTVSDHMGGYTTSVARIDVEPDFSLIQDWGDIVTHDPFIDSDIRFFAPMSKVYADYVNAPYTSTAIETGEHGPKDVEVVKQTLDQARQYCKTRGARLPLVRELETLFLNEGDAYGSHNWPAGTKYWAAENINETNASTYDVSKGIVGNQSKTVAMYTTCVDLSNSRVKGFSTQVAFKQPERFSSRYDFELKVFDPDGALASYADVNMTAMTNRGLFINHQSEMDAVANELGTVNNAYIDTSFNEEVIQVQTNSLNQYYPFNSDNEQLKIDVTDPNLWSSEEYYNQSVYVADEKGLMLLPSVSYSKLFHVFKQALTGKNFVVRFKITGDDETSKGGYSAVIHQLGVDQTDWEQQGIIPYGNTPVYPVDDPTTLGVYIDLYGSMPVYAIEEGKIIDQGNMDLRSKERIYWLEKVDNRMVVYSATTEEHPDENTVDIELENNIDLNKPYWLSFGGKNHDSSANVRVTELYFAKF
ncbi:hypothetical protein K6U21_05280 [Vibrio vulnificus]|uniref:hypothetical protein n=1 Tax=Vibrio vulnificus TaxID=672 RepID=UPI001EEC2C8C|nr:hypothetical protein [Vibrio vulnificus]MCG6303606.1 hypothetical protein [Vibrio vulnificus]